MKTKILNLTLAAMLALPGLALAQLGPTFLSAPDGDPTNALVVLPGGRIGIGTDEVGPKWKVGIYTRGSEKAALLGFLAGDTNESVAMSLGPDLGGISTHAGFNKAALLLAGGNSPMVISHNSTQPIVFGTMNLERMRISENGNVGIGTTSPNARLHVNGVPEGIRIQGSAIGAGNQAFVSFVDKDGTRIGYVGDGSEVNNDVFLTADIGNIVLYTSAGKVLTATSSGNVGIGTTDPQAKLDVNGKINCTVLELTSDRNQKQDFAAVDSRRVLDRLVYLPITTWAYTNDAKIRRIGPMAQDWKATFPELGSDDKHIAAGDLGSVALAAIQGLNTKLTESLKEKDTEIAALQKELSALKIDQATFAARFEKLEKVMAQAVAPAQPAASSAFTTAAR